MALNENIRKLREENNYTQQQLADKLYVSRQTVCRWENGSRCPDLIMAKKLAVEFHVSLDELISDEDARNYNLGSGFKGFNERMKLQEYRKKVLDIVEIIGGIFLALSILFSRYLNMRIPVWCTIAGIVIVGAAILLNVVISKKLDRL